MNYKETCRPSAEKRKSQKIPRFTLRSSWKKRDLHRTESTANFSFTANNPSQNISDLSAQKHLRTQINNVQQSANENFIEPQSEETNTGVAAAGLIRPTISPRNKISKTRPA